MTTAIIANLEKLLGGARDGALLPYALGNEWLKAGDPGQAFHRPDPTGPVRGVEHRFRGQVALQGMSCREEVAAQTFLDLVHRSPPPIGAYWLRRVARPREQADFTAPTLIPR